MPTYQIVIRDPTTGRVYLHGEQFRSAQYPANEPTNWPTRAWAEWTAQAVRDAGKVAEVVEVVEEQQKPQASEAA